MAPRLATDTEAGNGGEHDGLHYLLFHKLLPLHLMTENEETLA